MKTFFRILFSLFPCWICMAATPIVDQTTIPLLNPQMVEQERSKLRLDNGLEILLVSDPNAVHSSAALGVRVGSWDDPDDIPGMAHFCEHMLFMGTKKYPEEGEYRHFIEANNGTANAFTADDHTCYGFAVAHAAFLEALDRFGHFFIDPLFHPSGVARELQAIDQEFAKAKREEAHRIFHVYRELAPSTHCLHKFTCGNSQTLSVCSQERLREWYEKHYSSHLMHLVVYSALPLEDLESQVEQIFSAIPRTNSQETDHPERVVCSTHKAQWIHIDPIKKTRELLLFWEIPASLSSRKKTKPAKLAATLLNHPHPQSLRETLKEQHYVKDFSASVAPIYGRNHEFLLLSADLTSQGEENLDKVMCIIFSAIASYQQTPPPTQLLEQLAHARQMQYQFDQTTDPFHQTMKWACQMMGEDLATFPEESLLITEVDPFAVREVMQSLTPAEAVYFLLVPEEEARTAYDRKEEWMEVPYRMEEISDEKRAQWEMPTDIPFAFAPLNRFLPENLELLHQERTPDPFREPELLVKNSWADMYVLPDTYYQLPKIHWAWEIQTPSFTKGYALQEVFGDLYLLALSQHLDPLLTEAQQAGMHFSLSLTDRGIGFRLKGYSDKANDLLEEMFEQMNHLALSPQQFAAHQETLLHRYENKEREAPYCQMLEHLRSTLYRSYASPAEKKEALQSMHQEQWEQFRQNLFHKAHVVGLLYGNLRKKEAEEAWKIVQKGLPIQKAYPKEEVFQQEAVVFPDEEGPFFVEIPLAVPGNAALLAIETHPFSWKQWASWRILSQTISGPFFSTLRSQQQTGYIVVSAPLDVHNHLFSLFLVQSHTHDPRDLLARYELFLEEYIHDLDQGKSSPESFLDTKEALLEELRTPPTSMHEMGGILENMVFDYEGDFSLREKKIAALEDLTLEEYRNAVRLSHGKTNRKRLALLGRGETESTEMFSYQQETLEEVRQKSSFTRGAE